VIEWLLGGGAAAGVVGIAVLAIYLVKMARDSRADLKDQLRLTKEMGDLRRDHLGYKHAIERLEEALHEKTDEAARERAATDAAEEALGKAYEQLASSKDPAGAVAAVSGALQRLSKLSETRTGKTDTPADRRDSADSVHGSASRRDG